jgi:DNA-binding NtrC family response regulator
MAGKPSLVIDQSASARERAQHPSSAGSPRQSYNPFLGTSPTIRELENKALRLVNGNSPVLIQGESGSGKGVLAQWLHQNSPRHGELHVELQCTEIPPAALEAKLFGYENGAFGSTHGKPGLLEIAEGGSVFLEEIGELELQLQEKILRMLEENTFRRVGETLDRKLDARVLASSTRDLARKTQQNRFSRGLYLHFGEPLVIPPLRERVEDIPLLATHILERIAIEQEMKAVSLPASALEALQSSPWPGNIRQLRNSLEQAVLGSTKGISFLDGHSNTTTHFQTGPLQTLEEMERQYIKQVLLLEGGRVQSAAKKLGIPRSSLYHKLKQYGMSRRGTHSTDWDQTATGT